MMLNALFRTTFSLFVNGLLTKSRQPRYGN